MHHYDSIYVSLLAEMEREIMGAANKIRKRLIDLGMTQIQFSEQIGKSFSTVRNLLSNDNLRMSTLEEWADALGCDVALIDRETGEIYR